MSSPTPVRRATTLVAVAMLLAGCGDTAPSASPSASASAAPASPTPPPIDLPVPDEDTSTSQVLLKSSDGTYDVYGSIGQLQGAASTCTAVLLDTGESGATPAYAITNGHCVGINGANEIIRDQPGDGAQVAFDWFVDRPEHRVVAVTSVAWASMHGTDLAILELDTTPGELRPLGLKGWRTETLETGGGASLDVVLVGIPVGVPLVDIPEKERFLRLGTCSLDADPVPLNERQWLWPDALRNDCPEVLPGNSGSAVLDRATGGLVGLINTTTFKGEGGAECWLGRPCEITPDGEQALPDTSYAQPVGGLERCFAGGSFALGGGCPLSDGSALATLTGAPLAVNPAAADPVTGKPGQATWATTVEAGANTWYRYRIGPLESTSCGDESGYGTPRSVAVAIDDPLPTTEQRLLLCVVTGPSATVDGTWQAPADAAVAVAYVDTTAPSAKIEFSAKGSRADGWRVEPIFNPPELSVFMVKFGRAASTVCADAGGYKPYRRQALVVPARLAPVRFCVVGYDDAGNASRPAAKVLQ
jgi:hypothetical protein